MVRVDNLSFAFGSQTIFDDVGFTIGRRERIGLVGRNGSGKTTLLNLLAGDLRPDGGSISLPRDYRIGYVSQRIAFQGKTVLEEASRHLEKGGTWRAEKVLFGLGFAGEDLPRRPDALSGGFQARLHLTGVLLGECDLLLLDEPTNYLDILAIRWLTSHLQSWRGELVLITHDRGFMDGVTSHTMIIHREKIRKIAGPTAKLYEQIAKEEEIHEKTRRREEKRVRDIEVFIGRFRAKARLAGLVQSRVKLIEKRGDVKKLEKLKNLDIAFRAAPLSARYVMEAKEVAFAYDARPLIDGFSLTVGSRDRIGVIGRNGRGKTTLLKLLAGMLEPRAGLVSTHPKTRIGYFGQTAVDDLAGPRTVEGELQAANPDLSRKEIMDACGALLFGGESASKTLDLLSGGEKARVLLGKILLRPVNLLLLDEPSNHLDMESCDSLLAAIDSFPGAVIIVTHSELFLRSLVDRLVVFGEGGPFVQEGGYGSFLDSGGWVEERDGSAEKSRPSTRQERAERVQSRSRRLAPLRESMERIEGKIRRLEEELARNNEELVAAARSGDGGRIGALSRENHRLQGEIDALYTALEEMLRRLEEAASSFGI
jgi:ATP-binding cassette subfamily F protein 3